VVGTRKVDRDVARLAPGPDGGLVVASWVGEPRQRDTGTPPSADDVREGEGDTLVVDGQDLRVRLEDAATGDERWQRTLRFDEDVEPYECVFRPEDRPGGSGELHADVHAVVRERTIWVGGCGIDAWLTADGHRLDGGGDPSTFEGFSIASLDSGAFVARHEWGLGGEGPGGDRLLAADGSWSRALQGRYLAPQSTDGRERDVQLVRRQDDVVALDAAGDELWTAPVEGIALPVRTARVAVVVDRQRAMHGLDLATGELLWVRDDLFDEIDTGLLTYGPYVVEGAFTDGHLAAFVVPDLVDRDQVHWFAIDVATGADLWDVDADVADWGAHLAVDGYLVRWSPTQIVGLSSG
jgi:hypothetical protein